MDETHVAVVLSEVFTATEKKNQNLFPYYLLADNRIPRKNSAP
jgi:hypothetical protein